MPQKSLLIRMENDFQIGRKIFLNLATGWYDRSRHGSNLVHAGEITAPHIQGRYRLNLADNKLRIQEFFFDLEWSNYTEDGQEIKVITKQIVNAYFPRLKQAALKLLGIILQYIPKQSISIRASGSGLHIIFFLKGVKSAEEWHKITSYLIKKSSLPNTKNAKTLVFGLDKDTILSSDRKIAEFGSWNRLKKDFKKEADYLNFATYLSVDEFLKAESYPFCPDLKGVKYPAKYEYCTLPEKLRSDSMSIKEEFTLQNPIFNTEGQNIIRYGGIIEKDVSLLTKYCPCYWNILRDSEATWYARQFLVKFLKYALNMDKKQILSLIDKYTAWSDYNPKITAFYVSKHFREGTCETKVKKPPRRETLVKYGLCKGESKKCVYTAYR